MTVQPLHVVTVAVRLYFDGKDKMWRLEMAISRQFGGNILGPNPDRGQTCAGTQTDRG